MIYLDSFTLDIKYYKGAEIFAEDHSIIDDIYANYEALRYTRVEVTKNYQMKNPLEAKAIKRFKYTVWGLYNWENIRDKYNNHSEVNFDGDFNVEDRGYRDGVGGDEWSDSSQYWE